MKTSCLKCGRVRYRYREDADSEGYIHHGKNGQRSYLDIANKDLDLLAVTVEIMATLGIKAKVYGPYPYSRGVAHLRANADGFTKTTEMTRAERKAMRESTLFGY